MWAPRARSVEVHLLSPHDRFVPMHRGRRGYHQVELDRIEPGTRYRYRLDGDAERDLPDPASRSQPEGVHGPSEVTDPTAFRWTDRDWRGLALSDLVFYELHVGTFSTEGTFDGAIAHLDELRDLSVTAVELMPVAQFPGTRNWGYDGVFPYAVQDSYGGPTGLARLVDACHRRGLAVVLDVVYNHLGPEGNSLQRFGPYLTSRYHTPWGKAVNVDGRGSDEVRRYFIENALMWLEDYHVDALRLDAVHGIVDTSAHPFLRELEESKEALAERLGRRLHLVAESDLNDRRLVERPELGGFGLDAQWNDDFHHAVHALLTGDRTGYYADFGSLHDLTSAIGQGYVYAGRFSGFRGRSHGSRSRDLPATRFVVFTQNHDQVGNRMKGERLSELVPFEGLKLAAGVLLLSPGLPLLFMGEEYGETSPFQYFVSHSDPGLIDSVQKGRAGEFAAFGWDPSEVPDPQDEATFLRSKLDHSLKEKEQHRMLLDLYRELFRLRRQVPALARQSREDLEIASDERERVMAVRRWSDRDEAMATFNFGDEPAAVPISAGEGPAWRRLVDSADPRWGGPGSGSPEKVEPGDEGDLVVVRPRSFVLFAREREDA